MYAKLAFYNDITKTADGKEITLQKAVALITDDKAVKAATQRIQREYGAQIEAGFPEGKKAYQKAKKDTLGGFIFSGNLTDRSSGAPLDNFIHSGLVTLDIDGQGAEMQAILAAEVLRHPNVVLCAKSVSGIYTGDFWAAFKVEIPEGVDDIKQLHKDYHSLIVEQLNKATGAKLGGNGDLTRVRYVTHDPELYFNPEAEAVTFAQVKAWRGNKKPLGGNFPQGVLQEHDDVKHSNPFEDAVSWAKRKGYDYVPGQKHDFRTHIAIRLNWLGVPQADAQTWVETNYPGKGGIAHSVSGPYRIYASTFGQGKHILIQRAAYERAAEQLKPQRTDIKLEKGEYLSEKAQYILSLLEDKGKVHLQAGTGSGKSYMAAVELAKHTKRKIVIACSLNPKVMKDAEQYNIAAVTGALMKDFGRKTILDTADLSQVVLCSYEQVPRLASRYGDEDPVFIIDESHNLGYSWRNKNGKVSAMWQAVEPFNVIAMTGTPMPYLAVAGFYPVKVSAQRPKIAWHLRNRLRGALSGTISKHVQSMNFNEQRLVCLINSRNQIESAKKALLKKGFKRSELVVLYSSDEVKASKEFKKLIDARGGEESFADQVKVVLTTSLIGEGVDVYSSKAVDFMSVHREQKFNPIQLVQFADRWRTEREKRFYTYLLEADEPEDWQQGENYRAEAFFKLQLDYFTDRVNIYNKRAEEINERWLDQRLVGTATQYSDEEKCILRNSETGRYSVSMPALMARAEAQRHKHRTQQSAINEVLSGYPYFNLIDERAGAEDVTDADVHEACNEEANEREQAKKLLAQLVEKDFDALVQAVALKSQDKDIKKLAVNRDALTKKAHNLHTKHPALFNRFLGTSEGIVYRYAQASELGIEKSDYIRVSTDAGLLVYAEVVKRFIEGLKLHILFLLYFNRDGNNTTLTVQQARDAQRLERFIVKLSENEGKALTGHQIKQIADTTLGHRAKKFTQRQAVTIAGYFCDIQQARSGDARTYSPGKIFGIDHYLKRSKIIKREPFLRRYENYLTRCLSEAPLRQEHF